MEDLASHAGADLVDHLADDGLAHLGEDGASHGATSLAADAGGDAASHGGDSALSHTADDSASHAADDGASHADAGQSGSGSGGASGGSAEVIVDTSATYHPDEAQALLQEGEHGVITDTINHELESNKLKTPPRNVSNTESGWVVVEWSRGPESPAQKPAGQRHANADDPAGLRLTMTAGDDALATG